MKEIPRQLRRELERLYDNYDVVCDEIVQLQRVIEDRKLFKEKCRSWILGYEKYLRDKGIEFKSELGQ